MNKLIKNIARYVLPKEIYEYLRKLRLNVQFKYLDLRYRGKKSVYNYKGYKFIVRNGTDDDAIVREVIDGDYNIDNEKYDVVVDIGAHIGAYSILMANRANKIYSFEPNPESFELLKRNVKNINANNLSLSLSLLWP